MTTDFDGTAVARSPAQQAPTAVVRSRETGAWSAAIGR
jgi:hypothetical protein